MPLLIFKMKKSIQLDYFVWKKLQIERLKHGYSTANDFIKELLSILTKFKPELKEGKK